MCDSNERSLIVILLVIAGLLSVTSQSVGQSLVPSEATPPPGASGYSAAETRARALGMLLENVDTLTVDNGIRKGHEVLLPDIIREMPPGGGVLLIARVAQADSKGMRTVSHRYLLGDVFIGAVGKTEEEAWAKYQTELPKMALPLPPSGFQIRTQRLWIWSFDPALKRPPLGPQDVKWLKEQLQKFLRENSLTFEREWKSLANEGGRLRDEATQLAQKKVPLDRRAQESRRQLDEAVREVVHCESQLQQAQLKIDDRHRAQRDHETQYNALRDWNNAFMARVQSNMQADVQAMQNGSKTGWVYDFGRQFSPLNSNGVFTDIATHYRLVLDQVTATGEFPPVEGIAARNGVTPATRADFDTFNANVRELRRLAQAKTGATIEVETSTQELSRATAIYQQALANVQYSTGNYQQALANVRYYTDVSERVALELQKLAEEQAGHNKIKQEASQQERRHRAQGELLDLARDAITRMERLERELSLQSRPAPSSPFGPGKERSPFSPPSGP